MTAVVTLADGRQVSLPPLLQWNIKHTDSEPCGSFSVRLVYDASMMRWLSEAISFRAEENGETVFFGFTDDWELSVSERGVLLEMNGRSPAAKLLDNQVRAAEYQSAQLEDILRVYVRPYGITRIEADAMPQVRSFTVETGNTCWQVLCGFCRHSADIRPGFSADGRLLLKKERDGKLLCVTQDRLTDLRLCFSRYGVCSRQIIVNTRDGSQVTAENAQFAALGGNCVHVAGTTGNKLRATWRTAQQRLDDAARLLQSAQITLPGNFAASPGDRLLLDLPALGVREERTVAATESIGDETGLHQTFHLR